jgi:integrase
MWTAGISLGYDGSGKRRRRFVYGSSKKEVQDRLGTLQASAISGTLTDAGQITVGEFLERWLNNSIKQKVSPTTHSRYEQHARLHITPHIGRIRLTKLTALHIEQLLAAMTEAGDSLAEQHKVGKALRQALRHAVGVGLIPANPASRIALPRAPKKEMQPLNGEQTKAFIEAAAMDRLAAMYVVAVDSGMRQGELFGLQWSDVDFDTGSLQVQRSLEEIRGQLRLKDVKTAKARRRIPLSGFALDALNEHRRKMLAEGRDLKTGPVFCDSDGGWLRKSNVQRRSFRPILKRAKVPAIRFHDLRHTCATLLLLGDVNAKIVSERLGHASIEITLNTYAHVLPTMQQKAAQQMDRVFARKAVAT